MLCIATGGNILALTATTFTLSWTHSVERIDWRESWRIIGDRLQLVEASVEGPGAGIALPEGAEKTPQGWVFTPKILPLPRLTLAASGMTHSGWTLCTVNGCAELGTAADRPIEIWAAPVCRADTS